MPCSCYVAVVYRGAAGSSSPPTRLCRLAGLRKAAASSIIVNDEAGSVGFVNRKRLEPYPTGSATAQELSRGSLAEPAKFLGSNQKSPHRDEIKILKHPRETLGIGLAGYGMIGNVHALAYRDIPTIYPVALPLLRLACVCTTRAAHDGGFES